MTGDRVEHKFTGIYSGMTDQGMTPHCSCGWTMDSHKQYRGGGELPTTDLLAEYVNHVTERMQTQIDELVARLGEIKQQLPDSFNRFSGDLTD